MTDFETLKQDIAAAAQAFEQGSEEAIESLKNYGTDAADSKIDIFAFYNMTRGLSERVQGALYEGYHIGLREKGETVLGAAFL